MTIKQIKKNVSAENFMTLDTLNVTQDRDGNTVSVVFTKKNFYTDEVGDSYTLTDDFYTKKQINDLIKIHFVFADADHPNGFQELTDLPIPAQGSNYIYMVEFRDPDEETDTGEGIYREYIWVEQQDGVYTDPETNKKYGYESIGSTEIDISDMQVVSNILKTWANPNDITHLRYPSAKLVKDTFDQLSTVAWSGEYSDILNTPYIPTKTSDLTNDGDGTIQDNQGRNKPFLMEHQSLANYLQKSNTPGVVKNDNTIVPIDTTAGGTQGSSSLITSGAVYAEVSKKEDSANLKTVARTGNYDDLINKPSIPTKTSDITNDGDGIAGHGSYVTQSQLSSGFNDVYTKSEINNMEDAYVLIPTLKDVCDHSAIKDYATADKTLDNLLHEYNGVIEDALLDYANEVHKTNPCIISLHDVGVFLYLPDRNSDATPSGTVQTIQPDLISAIPLSTGDLVNNSGYITIYDLADYLKNTDVKDSLTLYDTQKPLSANKGRELSERINTLSSSIANAGYITSTDAAQLYLPTSGGTLTGSVAYPSTKPSSGVNDNFAYVGTIGMGNSVLETIRGSKSFIGTIASGNSPTNNNWKNIISLRYKNGADTNYGFYLSAPFDTAGNLVWAQDLNDNSVTEKIILDSSNYVNYRTQVLNQLDSDSTEAALSAAKGKALATSKLDSKGNDTSLKITNTTIEHNERVTATGTPSLKKIQYDKYGHLTGIGDATTNDLSDSNSGSYSNLGLSTNNKTQQEINTAINTKMGSKLESNNLNGYLNTANTSYTQTQSNGANTYEIGQIKINGTTTTIYGKDILYNADEVTLTKNANNTFSIKSVPAHNHDGWVQTHLCQEVSPTPHDEITALGNDAEFLFYVNSQLRMCELYLNIDSYYAEDNNQNYTYRVPAQYSPIKNATGALWGKSNLFMVQKSVNSTTGELNNAPIRIQTPSSNLGNTFSVSGNAVWHY